MSNKKQQEYIDDYLYKQKRDYITSDFAFVSYTKPNTMLNMNNDLPEMMLKLPKNALQLWLRSTSLLKRNHDPVFACTIVLSSDSVKDLMSPTRYYIAKRYLLDNGWLIKTPSRGIYIVNIQYANKLFKPKLEI